MKRLSVLALCSIAILLVSGRKQITSWESPYTPTRLEWLALQCNLNHSRTFEAAHASFLAVPPNKLEVIVRLAPEAKAKDAKTRQDVQDAAKEYVGRLANAMGWKEPLEVEAIEVVR